MKTELSQGDKPAFAGGKMTKRHHFALSSYWFATNLLWGALLMVVVPSQMIDTLAPRNSAAVLGLLLGLGAVPALVVPLMVGPLSDRCMSRWGRRRPYMVYGTAVNLVGLFTLWFAGSRANLPLYFVGYFITNVGNNIATGAYSGIIPDIVPAEQRGVASGWMAAMSQAGTILGVVGTGVLMNMRHVAASYLMIAVSMVVFLLITVLGVREQPRKTEPEPMDWISFVKSLWIDPRKYPDFAWVWVTRALVVMGLWTVQEYMQLFLTSVMGVKEADKEIVAAGILVVAFTCATVTGLIGGSLSDRIGRKRVVYVSNTVVALSAIAFIYAPSLSFVYVIGAIFGLGFGAYYSVDWAMGCDVLPHKEEAAKDMAVWHVAFVLPQCIALPIAGALLGAFGRVNITTAHGVITHYTRQGFTAIYALAAFFLVLGAILLRNVRGVR